MLDYFKNRWPDMFENVYIGFDLPPGWKGIVEKLCSDLALCWPESNIKVAQVKNKLGSLRFYIDCDSDHREICSLIEYYQFATGLVCLDCGTSCNVNVEPNSYSHRCDDCKQKRIKLLENQ